MFPDPMPFRHVTRFALSVTLAATAACGSDSTSPASSDPLKAYAQLTLNHHAVTLALASPYDTIRFVATPEHGDGTPLPGTYSIRYHSLDSTLVRVDSSTGAAVALAVTGEIFVVAQLTIGNVTHSDTAVVQITDDVPPSRLATFSIQPFSGDSAKFAIGAFGQQQTRSLDLTMIDSAGSSKTYPVFYRSADAGIITMVDARQGTIGTVFGLGSTWLYATTTVYGVTLTDSVRFTVGRPVNAEIDLVKRPNGTYFANPEVDTLGVGAGVIDLTTGAFSTVTFANATKTTVDIIFDDSLAVLPSLATTLFGIVDDTATVGNIRPWTVEPDNPLTVVRFRSFPTAGTYHYHSTRIPSIHGTIVIVP